MEFKRIGIADNLISHISGKTYEKSIYGNDTLILPFTNIRIKDIKTDSIIGTKSNSKVLYKLTLPKSEYDLEFQFFRFNSLIINNFKIRSEETLNLSLVLGQREGKTEYNQGAINSFKKIIE